MDLDALRKAALSSKKRKLTPQPLQVETNHHLIPFQGGQREKEEGEIEDESAEVEVNPVVSSRSLLAVKEESKDIISQLLSYGIPADYLLSIGISREILLVAFDELHLDSSLIPPQLSLSAQSTPFRPSRPSLSPSESLNPLPYLAPSNGRDSQYYPTEIASNQDLNVDYDALEQEKRQKLLARKAALKARNQRQAQSLESELESLFASAPPSGPDSVNEGGEGDDLARDDGKGIAPVDSEPSAKRPRHSYAPQGISPDNVRSLRDSIDHTEEIIEQPPSGPFAYNPSFAYPHNSNNHSTSTRRPVATDLEHLPSHRLSQTALSRQRIVGGFAGSLFNGGLASSESMVIDISDDEEDDGGVATTESVEDVDMKSAKNDESRSSRVPSPENARLTIPSIPPNNSKGATSTAAQVGEILRKRQLEEKELEIQRIMDRIKDMEERKKRGVSAQTEDGATNGGNAALDGSSVNAVVSTSVENSELVSATSTTEKNLDDSPLASSSLQAPSQTRTMVDPVYRPYNSTLSRYPLLGGRPSASLSIPHNPSPLSTSSSTEPVNSSTDDTNSFCDSGSAGLSTFVAQKRQLDPGRKWCKAETLGGVCQDGGCKGVHGRDWIAKDTEKAEYLLQQHTSTA